MIGRLNLFKSSSENRNNLYRQRITTWIFIVFLTITLSVCAIYWAFSRQTKIITIENPSRADYDRLWQSHSHNLQCPCSQVAILYSDFVYLQPSFHQFCSNRIVSPAWYENLLLIQRTHGAGYESFELTLGGNYFRALNSFCSLTKNFMADAYRVFSTDLFINKNLVPKTFFDKQIAILIDTFTKSTYSKFNRIFEFTRDITQTSQFAARTFSNFQLIMRTNGTVDFADKKTVIPLPTFPEFGRGGCSCTTRGPSCGRYAYVILSDYSSPHYLSPDLFDRCLLTDSTLSSGLGCWYNSSCFDLIQEAYTQAGLFSTFDGIFLDADIPSRFPMSNSVETMMKELLIENWITNISYGDFFQKCAPSYCSYPVEEQLDSFVLIINLVGLYGYLNKGLRLSLPALVSLILYLWRKIGNRMRVHSILQLRQIGDFGSINGEQNLILKKK